MLLIGKVRVSLEGYKKLRKTFVRVLMTDEQPTRMNQP